MDNEMAAVVEMRAGSAAGCRLEGPKALAERWGVPLSWIYARTREIPSKRIGRYVRFDPIECDAWLAQQQQAK